eukprot:TRINITY_DN16509_c0_g1_i1.p1 TRINITY_DN16509_c0_g1~~TRINITY_DN16509_c0_g1_i1.p1  ORF type:complete len:463 (-),score=112.55 TRINITY_DN16509_c0_g1_i1:53-1285(-)
MIAALEGRKDIEIVVYTGDCGASPEQILQKAKNQFGISLDSSSVKFVYLRGRKLIEAKSWPRFTMFGQSFGSLILGLEALLKHCPHIYIDSMGYAFTFPIFSLLGGCYVGAYVHYPTISNDMLEKVSTGSASFNNDPNIARSTIKTTIKIWYYKIFAFFYWLVGQFCVVVMVNSTWTKNHIKARWTPKSIHTIFPPTDCTNLKKFELKNREKIIVSIGQFRPEKNHALQLRAFAKFMEGCTEKDEVKLVLIGSVREHESEDLKRFQGLQQLAKELGIEENVVFAKNITDNEKKMWLSRALIGIHTMAHEHFGIGVVEFMAAGLIPVAHNSAGPKEDIVVPFNNQPTGFLATNEAEYAEHIQYILTHPSQALQIQTNARSSISRFSDEAFTKEILVALSTFPPLMHIKKKT